MLSLGAAYFSARAYLASGSKALLFLGSGALAYGLGPLGAWFLVLPGGTNIAITFSNTQFLVASILSFAGVIFVSTAATEQIRSVKPKPVYLLYLGILVFATSLAVAGVQGVLPLFFVPGVGGTPLRSGVLMVSVALFAVSCVGLIRLYFVSKSDIVYWYGLALGLISVGLTAYLLQRAVGGPIGWTGQLSQYTGCVCFLIAMLTATRATGARLR